MYRGGDCQRDVVQVVVQYPLHLTDLPLVVTVGNNTLTAVNILGLNFHTWPVGI